MYSNTNYVLLGMVAEAAGKKKIGALVREHAIAPAGLKATFFDGEEPLQGQLTKGFDEKGGDVTHRDDPSGPWSAGAMVASGADLCEWAAAVWGSNKVLSDPLRKAQTDGAVLEERGSPARYGLGVEVLDPQVTHGAGRALTHGGLISGFQTSVSWFPEKSTAVCAVVNQDGADPNPIVAGALDALFKK
jgi:D-alanyl-D-alanine carboxypeptidase